MAIHGRMLKCIRQYFNPHPSRGRVTAGARPLSCFKHIMFRRKLQAQATNNLFGVLKFDAVELLHPNALL